MCEKDLDIENFLKERAIQFEHLGKSRTFFIYDEEDDDFKILAYFTLALQVLKVSEELLSGRKTRFLDGFSSKARGDKITEFPTILIGQLGKNDLYEDSITGFDVMQYCFAKLLEGQALLGGRIIMLECKDIPYLIELYEAFGFKKLEKDYEEGELLQMIKVLEEEELIERKDTL